MGKNAEGSCRSSFIFIVLMFYLLFNPPIMGQHSLFFVAGFSWAYLLFNCKILTRWLNWGRFFWVYLVLILLLLWIGVYVVLNNGTKAAVVNLVYWIVAIFPAAIAINLHVKKNHQTIVYLLRIMLWAGFIQSILVLVAFLFRPIKDWFITELQADNTLVTDTYGSIFEYRLFGYSAGLTFAMPCAMAVLTTIAVYMGIVADYRYFLFAPTLAFAAFVNARTSIVLLVIGVIVAALIGGNLSAKAKTKVFLSFILAVLIVFIGASLLKTISPWTYEWVLSGLDQILGFFNNETDSGYFETVTNSTSWALPHGISLFIGTGTRVMGGKSFGVRSDIGYVNDIWLGGILYSFFIYSIVGICLYMISRNKTHHTFAKFISVSYLFYLPILNFKTYVVDASSFTTVLIILGVYLCIMKDDLWGISYGRINLSYNTGV